MTSTELVPIAAAPRPPKLPKAPKVGRAPLAVREINENLTISGDAVIAWYVLPAKHYSFLSDAQRQNLVTSVAQRYAALVGYRIYLRGTTRPYPARTWAKNLYDNTVRATPKHQLPGDAVKGGTFVDHLARSQQHLKNKVLADKVVYLGVRIETRTSLGKLAEMLIRSTGKRELAKLRTKTKLIDEIVARPGLDGAPATSADMEFLMHRSVGLGLPAPVNLSVQTGRWGEYDMGEFVSSVSYEHKPGGKTVIVNARRGDVDVRRHVAVMTIGRMDGAEVPAKNSPWMQATDRLGFPVDWMAIVDLIPGEKARVQVNKSLLRIRDQQGHYAEHGMDQPLELSTKADKARVIESQMNDGQEIVSGRAYGWLRLAVSGKTEEECLERVRETRELYRTLQINVEHPHGVSSMACQYPMMREFIPGEPLSTLAFQRHLTLPILAAGLPTVSAQVGDRVGPYIGYTSGLGRRAVMFDSHYATERQGASGLVPIVGSLGAGKSALLALLCTESARRGILTTVLDPSGPLAKLASMPEFRGRAMVLDLLRAPAGTLNPYGVIETPNPKNYATGEELNNARAEAEHQRSELAMDVIQMLLPPQEVEQPETLTAIQQAIWETQPLPTSSLLDVIANLHKQGHSRATVVANYLTHSQGMPASRLFFGVSDADAPIDSRSATLLIITMAGLDLPERGSDKRHWTQQQRISVPLLHLATHYVMRRVYGQARGTRKTVALDEVGQMGEWGSGKALFGRLGRDSRKWNAAIYVSSQDPEDVLGLNIANKNSGCFVGRIEDEAIARQALELLRVPTKVGYEAVLADLSPFAAGPGGTRNRQSRHFVMRDVHGSVERITIDMTHIPGLLEAIDTDARPDHLELEPADAMGATR